MNSAILVLKEAQNALINADYPSKVTKFIQEFIDKLLESPESVLYDTIDICFSPKVILREFGLIVFLQALVMSSQKIYKIYRDIARNCTKKGREIKRLNALLENSSNYKEWIGYAEQLDALRGYDKWRSQDTCRFYDAKIIQKRIEDTTAMMNSGDIFNLMFRIRGGISRDQFGIQHEGLFSRAQSGTKHLINRHHETVVKALTFICDSPIAEEEIPTDAKLAFFNETRHAYGRTALLLSGGAYLGYYHMGVLKSLFREGLLPRVISGASAGSLMAAVAGTRTDEELAYFYGDKHVDFRPPFFKFTSTIRHPTGKWIQFHTPSWLQWMVNPLLAIVFDGKILNLDSEHFKNVLINLIGTYTFQEAFDRTGRIINITVAPLNNYDPPRLLNYLTAPHVCVWSAAAASCALPAAFDSFPLIVKEPNGNFSSENIWTRQGHNEKETPPQTYSDGSIENDLPMKQLAELFNVNHFIVSQVNPHSALMSSLALQDTVWSSPVYGLITSYIRFLKSQTKDWFKNALHFLLSRFVGPTWGIKRGMTQALVQDYEGKAEDITIFPWVGDLSVWQAVSSVIKNPTEEEYKHVLQAASRSVWPHLARIRAQCMVEVTLDKCVQSLRRRIANEDLSNISSLQSSANSNQLGKSTLKTRDRTPSFYTSRSIVNLSGLSVADPIPDVARPEYAHSMVSGHVESTSHLSAPGQGPNPSLGSVFGYVSETNANNNGSNNNLRDRSYSLTGAAIIDDDNYDAQDNRFVVESQSPLPSVTSEENMGIKKTTSMARFYYRMSQTEDMMHSAK